MLVPFSIFMIFKKVPFGYHFLQKAEFGYAAFLGGTSLSRPCFSRNHSNHRAVGTYWCLERHSFDGDWFIFDFCNVLCNKFITFLHKTLVNAQPLSPPVFEKIAPHFQKERVSLFWFLTLAFFVFFIFSLIFAYPFPPLR